MFSWSLARQGFSGDFVSTDAASSGVLVAATRPERMRIGRRGRTGGAGDATAWQKALRFAGIGQVILPRLPLLRWSLAFR